MNSTVFSRESILSLARCSWWQCMLISGCQCVDTSRGSTDHIHTFSHCPQLWCNTHFSLRLFYSLPSTNIYFIHQVKQELTCDIDSYGVHAADLYSLTDDDAARRAQTMWSIIRMTISLECESSSRDVRDIWLIQSLSKHNVAGICHAESLLVFLLMDDNDDQMTLLLRTRYYNYWWWERLYTRTNTHKHEQANKHAICIN